MAKKIVALSDENVAQFTKKFETNAGEIRTKVLEEANAMHADAIAEFALLGDLLEQNGLLLGPEQTAPLGRLIRRLALSGLPS